MMATPAGAAQAEHSGIEIGAGTGIPAATFTTEALLLPLFATMAIPKREMAATPAGVVPTVIGAPITVPAVPSDCGESPGDGEASETRESVPSPEFVT